MWIKIKEVLELILGAGEEGSAEGTEGARGERPTSKHRVKWGQSRMEERGGLVKGWAQ